MTLRDNFTRLSIACGISMALLVGMAAAANAQDHIVISKQLKGEEPIERVSYADLNLASAAGERTLNRRVGGAVRNVCAPQAEAIAQLNCRNFAWRGARPQIDRAVTRASQMAANGVSSIAPVAIVVAAPR